MRKLLLVYLLLASVLVSCAGTAPMLESDESVIVTAGDFRRLGFEPKGTLEETSWRWNPTETSVEVDYVGFALEDDVMTLHLRTRAGVYDSVAEATRSLDEYTDLQREVIVEGYQPSIELRNDLFSGGDESSFWILRKGKVSLAYIFRLRDGLRASFLFLSGYMDDTPEFWQSLLAPHIDALETMVVNPGPDGP